jgi:hypothetical protein
MFGKLIKNGSAEKDIRDWLSRNGYYGASARFQEVELHAIQRPGWLQIFRFSVAAKTTEGEWQDLFGLLRDDDRYRRLEVRVFEVEPQRNELLDEWSAGLLIRRPSRYRHR